MDRTADTFDTLTRLRLKGFQHPAISYAAARAIADHPLQLALQRLQVLDTARDVCDVRFHHIVHRHLSSVDKHSYRLLRSSLCIFLSS